MVLEEDTEEIPSLALIPAFSSTCIFTIIKEKHAPVGTVEDFTGTRYRVHLACICLDTDPACALVAEEVVYDLEPLLALGIVRAADVLAALELALAVVAQECEHGDDAGWADVECELILEDRELLDKLGQALQEIRAVVVQLCGCFCILGHSWVRRRRLDERRLGSCIIRASMPSRKVSWPDTPRLGELECTFRAAR